MGVVQSASEGAQRIGVGEALREHREGGSPPAVPTAQRPREVVVVIAVSRGKDRDRDRDRGGRHVLSNLLAGPVLLHAFELHQKPQSVLELLYGDDLKGAINQ